MKFFNQKNKVLYIALLFGVATTAKAQQANSAKTDSIVVNKKLPFAIAKEKRLPDDELKEKKEGIYFTGVPDLSSDPINGFGAGAEGSLFFNGKKTNPFFEYPPYRAELNLALFITTKSQQEIKLGLDVPYIFNTKWRLRLEAAY